MQRCPMFHRVVVQTQIKPGTGFWGFELWKEKPVEVFSTSLWPNHVIPGRVFTKFGSDHTWDGRRQKCAVLWQWDHPQSLILYPSRTVKNDDASSSRNFGKRSWATVRAVRHHNAARGQKCIQTFSRHETIRLIKSALRVCHSLAKTIDT